MPGSFDFNDPIPRTKVAPRHDEISADFSEDNITEGKRKRKPCSRVLGILNTTLQSVLMPIWSLEGYSPFQLTASTSSHTVRQAAYTSYVVFPYKLDDGFLKFMARLVVRGDLVKANGKNTRSDTLAARTHEH
ncbi:hypothetical protein VTO42DRAFT_2112 [Malbranchea cinnamomea]